MDKNVIRQALEVAQYEIVKEERYKNSAWRFKLSNGSAVFCGDNGSLWCQGKLKFKLEELLRPLTGINKKVFVVYGRDLTIRDELIQLLESWDLEPLSIDNLPTQGRTVIEQLEKYIPEANYGIVLATPDDLGYLDGHEVEKKYRARQNVVLELGMLFSKLGRSKVAIVLKHGVVYEKPSDIAGILYLEYEKGISDIADQIKRELNSHGYKIV